MKTKMLLLAMMTLMAMTSCTTDEPAAQQPTDYDNNQDLPMFEYDRTKDFAFWPTPTIEDSELTGGGYDFAYWQQHKTEAESVEAMMAMCNIPKDLLKAMSTRNLAITCSNYPYNAVFMAYNDAYKGFLGTIAHFNGYAELMKRKGGLQTTLDLYAELDSRALDISFTRFQPWTFFVCSAVDHKVLSNEQVARLAQVVTARFTDGTESSNLALTYLLGGFIAYHYDTTLPDEQLYLLKSYLQFYCRIPSSDKPIDRISSIIESSLNRLAGRNP
jgi:hypothetical protein